MRSGDRESKKEKATEGTTGDNNQVQPTTTASHKDDQSDLCIIGRDSPSNQRYCSSK